MSEFGLTEAEKSKIKREKEKYSEEYITSIYNRLMDQHGIIMLPVEYSITIDKIKDITENYKDLVRFVVNISGERFVVLRYRPTISEQIDVKSVLQEADEAFKAENYTKSRELYLSLLTIFSKPSSFMYSRLALSLLRTGKKYESVDYFIMANYMARKEGRNVDYTELINNLRFGETKEEYRKENVKMDSSDFDYWKEDNDHGVDNFDAINDYILLTGSDVETACNKFCLTNEQIGIVKLLYAREFFIRKEMKKGEQFLKAYEESEYKTPESRQLYEEIRRTKKLYANREADSSKKLLLSLQPKSKNVN